MKETQLLDMCNLKPIKDIKTFKPKNVGYTSTKKIFSRGITWQLFFFLTFNNWLT